MPETPTTFGGTGQFPSVTQAQSLTVHSNNRIITKATMTATTSFVTGDIATYEMSADGGDNWQTATLGTQLTFTNTGTDLRWRITLIGIGGPNTYIDDLTIVVVEA